MNVFIYMFLKCFRTYRRLHIYEACPPLRWGGAHTSSHHSGVWCAGRATPSGGGSRPDGLTTLQVSPTS